MNIAKKIFDYRRDHGITQAALGEILGVSDKVISKWENGESLPSTELLPSLADCLGLSLDELFDRKPRTDKNVWGTVNNYFRSVPSDKAIAELQNIASYAMEAIEYRHSEERGWYKPEILAEIDKEWLELVEKNDPRPMTFYDNREPLKQSVFNINNDRLCFMAAQRYDEASFINILDGYADYIPLFEVILTDDADKMLKVLFSNDAPKQLTAEYLSEKSGVSVDKSDAFLEKVYGIFKENLPPVRNAVIEGKSYKIFPNPVTEKLQLVLSAAYFATQDWGGER